MALILNNSQKIWFIRKNKGEANKPEKKENTENKVKSLNKNDKIGKKEERN